MEVIRSIINALCFKEKDDAMPFLVFTMIENITLFFVLKHYIFSQDYEYDIQEPN